MPHTRIAQSHRRFASPNLILIFLVIVLAIWLGLVLATKSAAAEGRNYGRIPTRNPQIYGPSSVHSSLLRGRFHDRKLRYLTYKEEWLGWPTWVNDTGHWRELVFNLPGWNPFLMIAIAMCESHGQPWEVNSIGAAGEFQVLGGSTDPITNVYQAYHTWETQGYGAWAASESCWG